MAHAAFKLSSIQADLVSLYTGG